MGDDRRSLQQTGPAFAFGLLVGIGLGILATSPRSRRWMNEKAEWARTDGKEAFESARGHAREGFDAVKSSAQNIKEDVNTARRNSRSRNASDDEA